MTVFWDVAPYSVVETDRRFRDACCFTYQGDCTIWLYSTEDSHFQYNSALHVAQTERLLFSKQTSSSNRSRTVLLYLGVLYRDDRDERRISLSFAIFRP
jgi:hypothetical protein